MTDNNETIDPRFAQRGGKITNVEIRDYAEDNLPDPTAKITKKLQVTFTTGLPMGTCARFKHEGEIWIAYPAKKNSRILAIIERFLGIYGGITDNIVATLNRYPDNPGVQELAVSCLGSVDRARKLWWDLGLEKIKAETS